MCSICNKYVILDINQWGFAYPRFWEYEFKRQGFVLVKLISSSLNSPVCPRKIHLKKVPLWNSKGSVGGPIKTN